MITINNVSKWYGSFQVLNRLHDRGREGRGRGGLRAVGLGQVDADQDASTGSSRSRRATSRVDGISVGDPKTNLPKLRARIGMVFQHFELFPHLTVSGT